MSVVVLLLSAVEPARINRDMRDLGGWTALHEVTDPFDVYCSFM
jgi:hypothetical protein